MSGAPAHPRSLTWDEGKEMTPHAETRRLLRTVSGLLNDRQVQRLDAMLAASRHVKVEVTSIYQRTVAC
jgi:hypothetical protein